MSNQIINRVNLNKELYNIKTYGDKIDLTLDNITKYIINEMNIKFQGGN